MSLPSVSLFCLPGTEETVCWRLKNLLCASSPKKYPERGALEARVLRNIFCQAAKSQQDILCCQKALSRSYKSEPFLGVIDSTKHSSPLTQNCKLTLQSLHVKVPMEVRARQQSSLDRTAPAQSPEHWEKLWTSAEWQPCVWLNPAVATERTMKCMNKALWGSAGSLIYYTHVKPPTFILCIARIQQRIWFGLTYFISLFFT